MPRNPSKITRGRFVQVSTGIIIPFMFNPTTVDRTHGFSHGSQPIPGRSHPVYGGGAGMEETISFTLRLEGDRGRSDRRRSLGTVGLTDIVGLDVMPEINQLRALKLPHDANLDGAYGVPDRLLLNLGTFFSGQVKIDTITERILEWSPLLEVLRADLDISCHVESDLNETDWTFVSSEVSNALTEQPEILPLPERD